MAEGRLQPYAGSRCWWRRRPLSLEVLCEPAHWREDRASQPRRRRAQGYASSRLARPVWSLESPEIQANSPLPGTWPRRPRSSDAIRDIAMLKLKDETLLKANAYVNG